MSFEVVGGTRTPNQDQRTFRFPLEQRAADPTWTGRLVETLRVVVTGTRAGRATRITREEWGALDPADQGDIAYFVRDQQGLEEPVAQEVYETLAPERQGRKEYYRRERPRLADIEVWGFGDNLGPGMIEGGGSAQLSGGFSIPGPAFDGDFNTSFIHESWVPTLDRAVLTVDPGATLWLDALRICSSSRTDTGTINGYIVRGSEGFRDASGRLQWRRLSLREREDISVYRYANVLEEFAPSPRLRFLEILLKNNPDYRFISEVSISEYQLFSRGYPAEVVLTSDLIELPGGRNFGRITWEAEAPPGTNLEIHTRTGDTVGKVIRYFDKSGTQITADAWKNLLGSFKGPPDTTSVPASGWSPWSRNYTQPDEQVTSPAQRKFLQLQVKLKTEDRFAAASIRSIDLELLDPIAERVLAELWPSEVEVPGRRDTFEVFIQPFFVERPLDARSASFDEIAMSMPATGGMELLELSLGFDPSTDRAEQTFRPSAAPDIFVDENGTFLPLLANRPDSTRVRLPAVLDLLSGTPRVYNRITAEGEQVPVSQDGLLLTGASYGRLAEEEKGDIRYFRRFADGELVEVDQLTYQALEEEEKGPIRYFRILRGDGAQLPFGASGDSLSLDAYSRLPLPEQGRVIGPGPLLRLRFTARVFRNGASLQMAVRNTLAGADPTAPWQSIEPGDATPLVPSDALSIRLPLDVRVLDELAIAPNPFSPNSDGINDAVEIRFSVFKITAVRRVTVRIYTLDSRRIWETTWMVPSGQESVLWPGTDPQGRKVLPGLYLCQVKLDTDAEDRGSATRSGLIAVAY